MTHETLRSSVQGANKVVTPLAPMKYSFVICTWCVTGVDPDQTWVKLPKVVKREAATERPKPFVLNREAGAVPNVWTPDPHRGPSLAPAAR